MASIPATEKQKQLFLKIFEILGGSKHTEQYKKVVADKNLASMFIDKYLPVLNQKKEEYKINILKNINFEWLLLSLGYHQTEKSSVGSKQYRFDDDIITLRLDNSERAKLKTAEIFNYHIHFILEGRQNAIAKFDFELPEQNESRIITSVNFGGDVIEFVKNRALNYSEEQILFMLNEIANDKNKLAMYFKKAHSVNTDLFEDISNKKILNRDEKNKKCLEEYDRMKKYAEEDSNYDIRGINLNVYKQFMSSSNGVFITPERIDYKSKTEKDFSSIFFGNKKDSIIKNIVCPIFNINNGMLKCVGFQKNPIINPKIFDIAKEIEREKYTDIFNYIKQEDIKKIGSDEEIISIYEKLSKKPFPEDVKNNPVLMSIINVMLRVKKFDTFDEENKKAIYKDELLSPKKIKQFGSIGGVSIIKIPKDRNKKQAIGIFENPIFDGVSAMSMNYFDDYDITLVGSLGVVTTDFTKELGKMFVGFPYEKIYIMLDNDEAGIKNKEKIITDLIATIKEHISNHICGYDMDTLKTLADINRFAKTIINEQLYRTQEQKQLFERLSNTDIISVIPKNGKDFNEELLLKKEECNNPNNIKIKV